MIATSSRSKFSLQKSKRCFFFTFATAVCWILIISNALVAGEDYSARAATSAGTTDPSESFGFVDPNVIEMTSKNFGSAVGVGDGNVWLIEFYTPTCSHCVTFAPSYAGVAYTLHSSIPDEKIRVARVNCSVEKALMTRFGIQSFPSFFLVAGWDVYKFDGHRNAAELTDFARGGYKKKNPISFMNSPMGPMGLLQGSLIFVGTRAMGLLEYMDERFGISPIISGLIILMVGVFCGIISVILLAVLSTPKSVEKND